MIVTERAHAKINPFLRVLGRRDDGFHEIQTLILPVDLHDLVTIQEAERSAVTLTGPRAAELERAGGEALCLRAVEAFVRETGIATALEITVEKRIPVGAGMGGGSADAAAVLRALAQIHGVDPSGLLEVAASVGSDVPALLHGGAVIAEGRGERLTPVHAVTIPWVVVPQPFAVSTPDAYGWWDADPVTGPDPGVLIAALETGNVEVLASALFDDLEPAVSGRRPDVAAARADLIAAGAPGAVMTGSGPTVVAPAAHLGQADRIAAAVPGAFVTTAVVARRPEGS